MADEVFRPSRRRMGVEDVRNSGNNESLNNVRSTQQAVATEMNQPNPMAGDPPIKMTGNIPPELLARIQSSNQDEVEDDDDEVEDTHPFAQFRQPQAPVQAQTRPKADFQKKKKPVNRNLDSNISIS